MQAKPEDIEIIERAFYMPNILGYWGDIQARYNMMGFTDKLTDKDKIEEYDYITRQLNKYISSHKVQITKSNDLDTMLAVVEELHSKAPFEAKERKTLVYMAMRDSWLEGLYTLIGNMIPEVDKTNEEDNDGWI